jgi:hypothetical protein
MPRRRLSVRTYSPYSFLTSALDWSEWSASCPGRALPWGEGLPPVAIGQEAGWASAVLDTEASGKILYLCRRSDSDSPVVQSIVRHYWLGFPAPILTSILRFLHLHLNYVTVKLRYFKLLLIWSATMNSKFPSSFSFWALTNYCTRACQFCMMIYHTYLCFIRMKLLLGLRGRT